MTTRLMPLLVTLAVAVVATEAAQQLPTFRTGVRTVPLYATVTDREGRLVPDLKKDAFRVLDNGRPVDISVFSNDVQPITVAVTV